jgi:type II secretory pathway pseudopilin PulG
MIRHNESGVTMIELLLAMLLLAIALIGLAASFPLAMIGVATGGFQTTATLLAQQCIDIAKSIASEPNGYTTLPVSLVAAGSCPDGAVTGYDGFSRTTTITPATPTAQTTQIVVVVTFTGGGGGGINDTTLSTILAQ